MVINRIVINGTDALRMLKVEEKEELNVVFGNAPKRTGRVQICGLAWKVEVRIILKTI